jgi:ATP-dependent DNA ligase
MEPMKAVLTDRPFSDPGWIYERKLDGIRCLAFKADTRVRLRSRNDLSLDGRFPEIAAALEFAEACRKGWEGLIAKRADAPYTHGRSRDWLKFKCSAEHMRGVRRHSRSSRRIIAG